VARYAPDRDTAVAVLTEAIRHSPPAEQQWMAALQLTNLAPDTTGLVDVLASALADDWTASEESSYGVGIGGAGMAAAALARVGEQAKPALPLLRAAVLSQQHHYHSGADRRMAFEAYVTLCEDEAEIRTLLDEVAAGGFLEDEFLISVLRLAEERPAFITHLSRLIQTRFWESFSDYSYKSGWFAALMFLGERGGYSEIVLPALAMAAGRVEDRLRSEVGYSAGAARAIEAFLDRQRTNLDNLSEEERFIRALRGVAAADPGWLAYADWLDGQGDPRGDLIRLRHAIAGINYQTDPERFKEFCERQHEWLTVHGYGWASLYHMISQPPNTASTELPIWP
jgi:uncharacterized protein (TIGR02996 family)